MDRPTDATTELLERLVGIDSTSLRSNLGVLDAAEDALAGTGAVVERVASDADDRAGLLVRIGPDVDGGVVLSGHTDCVPVEGQPWTSDPFAMVERDGTFVGRGTTDMKGFLAAALAHAAPAAAAAQLARPLWLLLTWDEEVGTVGAGPMTDALVARTRPAACVVGEPTLLRPVTAHKGVRSFRVVVAGRDGHSSRPHLAASALVAAARLVAHVDDVAAEHRVAAADPSFDPPYTTFNVATLASGQAINIVPRRAEITMEYRPVPADDGWDLGDALHDWGEQHLVPGLQAVDPRAGIAWERGTWVPALTPQDDDPAEALVRRLTGFEGPAGTVPFGTDGGWHQRAGIPTVVCGPGDIDQAHQPDEWIAIPQLAACERFLTDLVADLQA